MVVLLLLLAALPYVLPTNNLVVDKPFDNSSYATINGVKIHYRYWAPQTADTALLPVVFVHGFSGSTFSWRKNTEFIHQQQYPVIAIDLPGFGFSDKRKGVNKHTTAHALLLTRLLDSLGYPNRVLVGHSMGAGVVASMAAYEPTKTKGLVMVDGALFPDRSSKRSFTSWLMNTGYVHRVAEVVARFAIVKPANFSRLLQSAYGRKVDSTEVMGYMEPFKVKGSAASVLEMSRGTQVFDVQDSLLTMPTLLFWGDKDTWVDVKAGELYRQKHAQAQFELVPGAGHCPMETHDSLFNPRLSLFLHTLNLKQ